MVCTYFRVIFLVCDEKGRSGLIVADPFPVNDYNTQRRFYSILSDTEAQAGSAS